MGERNRDREAEGEREGRGDDRRFCGIISPAVYSSSDAFRIFGGRRGNKPPPPPPSYRRVVNPYAFGESLVNLFAYSIIAASLIRGPPSSSFLLWHENEFRLASVVRLINFDPRSRLLMDFMDRAFVVLACPMRNSLADRPGDERVQPRNAGT